MFECIKLSSNTELFYKTQQFLIPYERFCCNIAVLLKVTPENVFAIVDDNKDISGVFSYTRGGSLHCCFPSVNDNIENLLLQFFKQNKISCIVAEKSLMQNVHKALRLAKYSIKEKRHFIFMEQKQNSIIYTEKAFNAPYKMGLYNANEHSEYEKELFDLHLEYIKEEVLPPNKTIDLCAQRLTFAKILKHQEVYFLLNDNVPIAKAQTTVISEHYALLGGIFTLKKYRNKGFATLLVSALARHLNAKDKTCVLYVSDSNNSAIKCYNSAGFSSIGEYIIEYL